MKPLPLLLTVSLAANAALAATFALRPALAPPAIRDWFVSDKERAATLAIEAAAAQTKAAAEAKAAAARKAGVWESLQDGDIKTFIARLRAAGFSPAVIRAIVDARLEKTFASRMAELASNTDKPYWKPESLGLYNNPKLNEARSQIYRDRARMLRELLGDEALGLNAAEVTAAQRRQYGDLPPAKIELVRRIMDDYADMASQVRAATQGVTLPEDREKLALLEKEKRADLAAILTPTELEDIEMRSSNVTNRLRTAMTIMDATSEEFAAIYRAQQPYADILFPSGPGATVIASQRQDAQAKVAEQLKSALGPERYAQYQRASDYDYQSLYRIAQGNGASLVSINQAYDLRASIAAESMLIHENKALSSEDRAQQLQALAAKAKTQFIAAVGSDAADRYSKDSSWLGALGSGYALRVGPDGRFTYMSPPPPRPNPATPAK